MRRSVVLTSVLCGLFALSYANWLGAATIKQIDVDESGNLVIRYQNPQANPDQLIQGHLGSDFGLPGALSTSTGQAVVLTYDLPFTPAPGDVLMQDKNPSDTISDVLRFVPADFVSGVSQNRLLFYSDNSDSDGGSPPLADSGLPTDFLTINGTDKHGDPVVLSPQSKQEDASENDTVGKIEWTPKSKDGNSDPGFFDNGGIPVKFVFNSEGTVQNLPGPPIPEPASLALLGSGAAVGLAMLLRHRRRSVRRCA